MWVAINILTVIAFFSVFFWVLRIKYQKDVAPSKKYPQGRLVMEVWQETGQRPKKLVPIKANGVEVDVQTNNVSNSRYFFNKEAVGRTKYPTQPLLPFSFLQIDADLVSWMENCPVPINPRVDTQYKSTATKIVCPYCECEILPADLPNHIRVVPLLAGSSTPEEETGIDSETKSDTEPLEGTVKPADKKKSAKNKTAEPVTVPVRNRPVTVVCPSCMQTAGIDAWLSSHTIEETGSVLYDNSMTAEGFAMLQDTDGLALGQAVNEEGSEELQLARANRLKPQYVYVMLIVAALGGIGAAIFAFKAFQAVTVVAGGG